MTTPSASHSGSIGDGGADVLGLRQTRSLGFQVGILFIILVLALPSFLIDLGVRDSTHTMENVAIASSRETWLRYRAGETEVLLLPTDNFSPRIRKPPLLVWFNLLAWSDLDPTTTSSPEMIMRARMVAVGFALLLVVSVWWIGSLLHDWRLGALAAIAASSMLFLQRQGRTASFDIEFTAWSVFAVAAACSALYGRRCGRSRGAGIAAWGVSTIALAACILTKGPLAFVITTVPIAIILVLKSSRPAVDFRFLAASTIVAAALVAPWYLHGFNQAPEFAETVAMEYRAERDTYQPVYYYLAIIALVFPWSVWLFAGVLQPLTDAKPVERRHIIVPLAWFAFIFLFFSLWQAKQQRYILPIVPAAALLVGQAFLQQAYRTHESITLTSRLARRIHWVGLLLLSLGAPIFLGMQRSIAEQGWFGLREPVIEAQSWLYALLAGFALLGVAVFGFVSHESKRPLRAAVLTGLWGIIAAGIFWDIYSHAPSAHHPIRGTAESFAATLGERPLRVLTSEEDDGSLNEEFRIYYPRLIRKVDAGALENYKSMSDDGPVYVIASPMEAHDRALSAAGFRRAGEVITDRNDTRTIWEFSWHAASDESAFFAAPADESAFFEAAP